MSSQNSHGGHMAHAAVEVGKHALSTETGKQAAAAVAGAVVAAATAAPILVPVAVVGGVVYGAKKIADWLDS